MDRYCVYLVTNQTNGKIYVGKTNDPSGRWGKHKRIAIGGKEKYPKEFSSVHGALKKYGSDNFKFEILEEIDGEHEAYLAETCWITILQSSDRAKGYNLNLGGEGGIQPTEEVRKKLIAAQNRPELLQLHSDLMKDRHQKSPGFLAAVNIGNQYRKDKPHSVDAKSKMSQSHKNNDHRGDKIASSKLTSAQVLEIRWKYENENVSQRQLAIMYGVSQSVISDIITRKSWNHI